MNIVDGSHLLHRIRFISTKPRWDFYSYGFTNTLLKSVLDLKDKNVLVCWDLKGSYRRRAISETYKKRDPIDDTSQEGKDLLLTLEEYSIARKWLHDSLPSMGFVSLMLEGIEADDIAYSLVNYHNISSTGTFLTEDKDWFQSLKPGWKVIRPISEQVVTYEDFIEKYTLDKISPKDLFVFEKAIDGDISDCIVGVPGLGAKTGRPIIKKYLNNEPLDMSKVREATFLEYINNGCLTQNIDLIDFTMITKPEHERIGIAYRESLKAWDTKPDFFTWVNLASEIESTKMMDFGKYLDF